MTIGLSESDNFPFVEQNNTSSQSQAHKTQRRKAREKSQLWEVMASDKWEVVLGKINLFGQ